MLNNIINKINKSLAKKCYDNGEMSACVDLETKCGYIEIELDYGNIDITIFHNNNNDGECENLCEFIKSRIDINSIVKLVEEYNEQDDWQDDPKYT